MEKTRVSDHLSTSPHPLSAVYIGSKEGLAKVPELHDADNFPSAASDPPLPQGDLHVASFDVYDTCSPPSSDVVCVHPVPQLTGREFYADHARNLKVVYSDDSDDGRDPEGDSYEGDEDTDADNHSFRDGEGDEEWEVSSPQPPSVSHRKPSSAKNLQRTRTRSLTDEDLDELKGCMELGFGFDHEESSNLKDTLPALELYHAINRHYADLKSRGSPVSTLDRKELARTSSADSSNSLLSDTWRVSSPGEHPSKVKMRLRHWAQVVACSIKQSF